MKSQKGLNGSFVQEEMIHGIKRWRFVFAHVLKSSSDSQLPRWLTFRDSLLDSRVLVGFIFLQKPQISWNTDWLLTQVLFTFSHDLKNGVGNVPLIILKLTRENCLYRTMFLYEEPADLNQSGEANATISSSHLWLHRIMRYWSGKNKSMFCQNVYHKILNNHH